MKVSVGIFAHNEEDTIGPAIEGFLAQRTEVAEIAEILVVSCASTDRTVDRATRIALSNDVVRVIARPRREGKIAAINEFLAVAQGEVFVLASADVMVADDVVELFVRTFAADPDCAMVGPRVVPDLGGGTPLVARLHELLWHLHHHVALRRPKLGEVVAVRAAFVADGLGDLAHCDEVVLEAIVTRRAGRLVYVPDAVVVNYPPARLRDLYAQRRRIACQHRGARRLLGYRPATSAIARGFVTGLRPRWPLLFALAVLEVIARCHGRIDAAVGKRYRAWRSAERSLPRPLRPSRRPIPDRVE